VKSLPLAKAMDDNTIIAISDEWRAPAPFQRLPCAADRARLDGDVLDEASSLDPGRDQAVSTVLMKGAYRIPTGMFPTVRASPRRKTR
jgi:hypothetical protein